MNHIALITGSSRGIGFEVARQLAARDFQVIVTSRDERAAAEGARKIGRGALSHALDTAERASITALAEWLTREVGRLDVLVNNAAILLDEGESILTTTADTFDETLRTNARG